MSWPIDDRVGAGHLDEGGAEELGQRLVPLVRDHPAHVVRLHDLRQISSHGQTLLKVLSVTTNYPCALTVARARPSNTFRTPAGE